MSDLRPIRQAGEQIDLRYLVRVGLVSIAIAVGSVLLVFVILRARGDVGVGGPGRVPGAHAGVLPETPIEAPERPARREAPPELDAYGWADRDAGVATIPIRKAMEIVARRGR